MTRRKPPRPNRAERRTAHRLGAPLGGRVVRLIIVHAMGEQIRADGRVRAASAFLSDLGLSAHALVHPDGAVERMVPDHRVAQHARGANDHSLGVEVLVEGVHDYMSFAKAIAQPWPSQPQLEATGALVRHWMTRHAVRLEQVVRHSDVDPQRKIDPGQGFPWVEFLRLVNEAEKNA